MINILIAEDEYSIAHLIREALGSAGYRSSCVHDGERAANEIENNVYDLILLDVMLPIIDGFELIE